MELYIFCDIGYRVGIFGFYIFAFKIKSIQYSEKRALNIYDQVEEKDYEDLMELIQYLNIKDTNKWSIPFILLSFGLIILFLYSYFTSA